MAFFGRGKNRIQDPYTLKDAYKLYISGIEKGSVYDIDYLTYVNICRDYLTSLFDKILNGYEFKMPYSLGRFRVLKGSSIQKDVESKPVLDWILTVKHHKRIYTDNKHSGGYKYQFFWNKAGTITNNLSSYRLIATRANKRNLAKLIKNTDIDYFGK